MGRPELGTKCTCDGCHERFYDLNRSPAICPKCGARHEPASPRGARLDRQRIQTQRISIGRRDRGPEPVIDDPEPELASTSETDDDEAAAEDEDGVEEIDPDHDAAAT
ncbi:MAG TPA: TIGR02300 family protein [Acetobacteraceae bacterium]|nr:TIGR02300 family protein [Acetobacteraceae bacterium]